MSSLQIKTAHAIQEAKRQQVSQLEACEKRGLESAEEREDSRRRIRAEFLQALCAAD